MSVGDGVPSVSVVVDGAIKTLLYAIVHRGKGAPGLNGNIHIYWPLVSNKHQEV